MAKRGAPVLAVAIAIGAVQAMFGSALSAEPPADGRELLARVKALVDAGQLFSPAAVAQAFPGKGPVVATDAIQTGACQAGLQKDIRTARWTFAAWFHNRPAGRPHLHYLAMSPMGQSGYFADPAGGYQIMDENYCSDLMNLRRERSASLRFDNLPGFSCVTADQVSSIMPLVDDHAMDGGGIYSYAPPAGGEYGTRVTFGFGGSECSAGFSAVQDVKLGTRYKNAREAFRQCTSAADHTFCATHPLFSWLDGHTQDLMAEFSARQCGGFGRYYRESRTPPPRAARTVVPSHPKTPCDGR